MYLSLQLFLIKYINNSLDLTHDCHQGIQITVKRIITGNCFYYKKRKMAVFVTAENIN